MIVVHHLAPSRSIFVFVVIFIFVVLLILFAALLRTILLSVICRYFLSAPNMLIVISLPPIDRMEAQQLTLKGRHQGNVRAEPSLRRSLQRCGLRQLHR